MGFQHMPSVVHRAASSKGGKIRGKKGLAAMSKEKARLIQSAGGKAHLNRPLEEKEAHNEPVSEQVRDSDGREPDEAED